MEKENNNFGLRVVDLSFSTDRPIIKANRTNSWMNWGEKNTYPQSLLVYYNEKSVTHKQIINRKVKMIAGNGLEEPNNPSQAYIDFVANIYGDMSIDKLAIKMAFDLVIFNGVSLNPHWNIDNSGLTRICYIPFERIRQDKFNSETDNGMPNYSWLSDDWCNYKKDEHEPQKYVQFSQKWNNDKSQIFYNICMDQGINWYPNPEYSPVVNYIDADWEIGNYHNSAIKNGFHAGFILNFATGIPTESEMDAAYEDIAAKFTGSNNANKFLLGWSNGKDGAPTLEPIPMNDSDTKYKELNDMIRDKILEAHEVTSPSLFGIPTPGTLGGRSELLEALSIYQSTYVDSKQKVIEDILNEFARLCGVNTDVEPIKLKKYVIDIPNIAGTPVLTIADIITLQTAISQKQIDNETALNILTTIYELDIEKASRLISIKNIGKTTFNINGM